eukprot:TRINITY_DN14474_c0_g1_i1.p1 TRINITY_DN14474_c0_g1~~TRINITY_DN14474_c0_g1_i1.p1  ORF type:complete len:124 (-),score=2.44 TRINITY_DN14474_c0_g1_i1:306-677(-)
MEKRKLMGSEGKKSNSRTKPTPHGSGMTMCHHLALLIFFFFFKPPTPTAYLQQFYIDCSAVEADILEIKNEVNLVRMGEKHLRILFFFFFFSRSSYSTSVSPTWSELLYNTTPIGRNHEVSDN